MTGTPSTIKVAHCADFHLGASFSSLGLLLQQLRAEDLQRTFMRLMHLCKKEAPDLLLVAGDLFDSPCPPDSLAALARDGFSSIPKTRVMVSPGNHDPASVGSCWLNEGFWPENVHVFKGALEAADFEDIKTRVWGAGFSGSHQDVPLFDPALTAADASDGRLGVLVMHADMGAAASPYNPLPEEDLASSLLDYAALGHIHKRTKILRAGKTYYSYPGSPEGLGFDEPRKRGALLGEIGKGVCRMQFFPLSQREYCSLELDVTGLSQLEAADRIRQRISSMGAGFEENLYYVVLTGEIGDDMIMSADYISASLPDVFCVKVKDCTNVAAGKEAAGHTLKDAFIRRMQERIAKSPDDETLRLALKLGLGALRGKAALKA